ncbi:MAG: hypothetical protein IPK42_00135 [Betaproteobacteria bacterium]|nr:hypothetical protein [Betaproteobacteria bacterium]
MTTHPTTPKQARHSCEQLLKADRADKTEKSILPSEVRVIDRLLERGLELEEAYAEIHGKLVQHPQALKVFFDLVQSTAAFWSPESNQEARRGRARLVEVNQEIERVAAHLAELLDERTELKNRSGFSCETLYHPVDAIHAAAARNYSYEQWVKARLEALTGQFDLKYWPPLSAVAQAIADDAARAAPPSARSAHGGRDRRAACEPGGHVQGVLRRYRRAEQSELRVPAALLRTQ